MVLRLRHRRLTAWFALVALLFAQLALAAYVCPGQQEAQAMLAMRLAGEPCDSGGDLLQPVLCHQHASAPAQSADGAKPPAATLPMLVTVLPLALVADTGAGLERHRAERDEPGPAPPDPLYLATFRLRI